MDSREIERANQEASSDINDADQNSMESFLDEMFKDSHACTHAHTCNTPGPDISHTHTCFHVHTKIISSPPDDDSGEKGDSRKRPVGNREAVRKYREKMKARAASLEDEVSQLREMNEQLMRKLHDQSSLEAEVMRLKCLLVDIRGRIEGEIGSFPYQKTSMSAPMQINVPFGTHVLDPCDMTRNDQVYCMRYGGQENSRLDREGVNSQRYGSCNGGFQQCSADSSSGSGHFNSGHMSLLPNSGVSSGNKKRGGSLWFSSHH